VEEKLTCRKTYEAPRVAGEVKRIRERQGERPPSAALARACRIAKTRRTMSGAGRVARPWI